jgi:hypothetical protein
MRTPTKVLLWVDAVLVVCIGVMSYLAFSVYDPQKVVVKWVNSERTKVGLEPIEMRKAIRAAKEDRGEGLTRVDLWLFEISGRTEQIAEQDSSRYIIPWSILKAERERAEREAGEFQRKMLIGIYGLVILLGIVSISVPVARPLKRKIHIFRLKQEIEILELEKKLGKLRQEQHENGMTSD